MRPIIQHQNLSFKAKTALALMVLPLIILSLTGVLEDPTLRTLNQAMQDNLKSLEILGSLKAMLGIADASQLPVLSGSSSGIHETLGKTSQYLSISGALLMVQYILAKISSLLFVKCIPIVILLWFILRKQVVMPMRILVLSLLLTPGLSIFTNGVLMMTHATHIDMTSGVHQELLAIQSEIEADKRKLDKHLDRKESEWKQKEQAKNSKLGKSITGLEEIVVVGESKLVSGIVIGADAIKTYLIKGSKLINEELIHLAMRSMTTLLFMILLLPLLYGLVIYQLAKKVSSPLNDQRKSVNIIAILLFTSFFVSCLPQYHDDNSLQTHSDDTHKSDLKTVDKSFHIDSIDTYILGVDVSHYNQEVDWKKVKTDGIEFAYAKATEGQSVKDHYFKLNWSGIKAAGMDRGAYHFYISATDPVAQASNFVDMVGDLESDDLVPMLDLEDSKLGDLSKEQYQENVLTWLDIVEQKLGKRPIIYSNPYFANTYLTNSKLSTYYLWIAEYGVDQPKLPNTWQNEGALVWQYANDKLVEGIEGKVDSDALIEDLETLK